jgi:plasmid rolling circle replication initiator protein Rep
MADTDTRSVGRSITDCSRFLKLLMELPMGGAPYAHLLDHNRCNRRLCPWCEWRRSLRWQRRIYEGLEVLAVEKPKLRPVLLTLTEKNCELHELGDRLSHMHKSLRRFYKRPFFPTDLWFRKTEITYPLRYGEEKVRPQTADGRACDDVPLGGRMAHPHIHMLLMVPPSYFSHGYVKSLTWTQEWMQAGRYDYVPNVDVRVVTVRKGSSLAGNVNLCAALEVGKYITKASDYQQLGKLLPEIYHQIRGHRMIGVSAAMRKYIPSNEPQGDELADEPVRKLSPSSDFDRARATWNELAREYWLAATEWGECPSVASPEGDGSVRALSPRSRQDKKLS